MTVWPWSTIHRSKAGSVGTQGVPLLEKAEALEQLRALWYGHRIAMVASDTAAPPGVDTREDLETVRRMWK